MPWQFYTIMHLIGIGMIFMAFGGVIIASMNGLQKPFKGRALLFVSHGVGMLLILVAGFGLMAKKFGMFGGGWPTWIYVKLVIWLILGGSISLALRLPKRGVILWFLLLAVLGYAAYIATYKPMLG